MSPDSHDAHGHAATRMMPKGGSTYPIVVDASRPSRFVDLREVWRYRSLVRLLAARDVKLRFRQTKFGVAWLVFNPLVFTAGYAFMFGGIGHVAVRSHSYIVFTYVGIALWSAFSTAFGRTCNCLLGNRELLTHAYFPRLAVPLANVVATIVDVLISWTILAVFLAADRTAPSFRLLLVPVWFALAMAVGMSVGLLVASWTIAFRDLQNITAAVVALGPIFTPVAYPASALPSQARFIATFNPLTPLLDGMRASALGGPFPSVGALLFAAVSTLGLLTLAGAVFCRAERSLADVI